MTRIMLVSRPPKTLNGLVLRRILTLSCRSPFSCNGGSRARGAHWHKNGQNHINPFRSVKTIRFNIIQDKNTRIIWGVFFILKNASTSQRKKAWRLSDIWILSHGDRSDLCKLWHPQHLRKVLISGVRFSPHRRSPKCNNRYWELNSALIIAPKPAPKNTFNL